jgi:hypothetical protein
VHLARQRLERFNYRQIGGMRPKGVSPPRLDWTCGRP